MDNCLVWKFTTLITDGTLVVLSSIYFFFRQKTEDRREEKELSHAAVAVLGRPEPELKFILLYVLCNTKGTYSASYSSTMSPGPARCTPRQQQQQQHGRRGRIIQQLTLNEMHTLSILFTYSFFEATLFDSLPREEQGRQTHSTSSRKAGC